MAYHWIHANNYTMNTFLLFDRWIIRWIMQDQPWYNQSGRIYKTDMGKALSLYPHVAEFCKKKAPECTEFIDKTLESTLAPMDSAEAHQAELTLLDALDSFVVYAHPEMMEQVNYIKNWDPKWLFELVDLTDKVVLDIGAGTGRLSFAASPYAKRVYASEPCDMLREYMRDKIRSKQITNIKVLDGIVTDLPFEDNTFDAVLAGHVVGDDYDAELAEMSRVLKDGGWIILCNGEDEFKRESPNPQLTARGFLVFCHESTEGGIIYNYKKQIIK